MTQNHSPVHNVQHKRTCRDTWRESIVEPFIDFMGSKYPSSGASVGRVLKDLSVRTHYECGESVLSVAKDTDRRFTYSVLNGERWKIIQKVEG